MNLGLSNSVAFVAGASSGLGRAVAKELLLEGARVAICSRDKSRIDSAADELRGLVDDPSRVLSIVCDVTDEAQIESAMDQTIAAFGHINLLVTNSGGPSTGMIDDHASSDWRNALELNLVSTINLSRYALPWLRGAASESHHASILMISSLSAKQPVPGLYLSNVSRAGVQGFAKSLSEEVGKAAWSANSALRRIGTEDEFAAAAFLLLSGRATFITGVALTVDGGAVKSIL
jgi:3-oxoacyl-[acyl-carrier protein] reductase